jgi:hypothetical protein
MIVRQVTYDVGPVAAAEFMDSIGSRAGTAGTPAEAWVAWRTDVLSDEVAIGSWACGCRLGESGEDCDERQSPDGELHVDD